jgi:hypothetical protein
MIQKLLAVESPDEPTEIVIHVNMLPVTVESGFSELYKRETDGNPPKSQEKRAMMRLGRLEGLERNS